LLLCAAAAFSQQSSRPGPEQLDLTQYISRLEQYRQTLRDSSGASSAVQNLRSSLSSRWIVTFRDQQFPVDTGWLDRSLEKIENGKPSDRDERTRTEQRLQLMQQAASDLVAESSADPSAARARLDEILSTREFRGSEASRPTALDRLRARVSAWWHRLLERIFTRTRFSTTTGSWMAWSLIAMVAMLLMFWAVRYTLGGSEAAEIDLDGAQAPGLDWHQWLGRAREAAERADYRQAIFAAYWTGVTRLRETKLVPQDESQTPREILRLLQRDRIEYTPLARLTRTFELVWYGHRDATATEWLDALQQLDKIGCPLPLTLRTANS
jgi:uncharacterized protein DUF4129